MESTPHGDRLVEIGVIVRAHGVRGWVRVRLNDAASTVLTTVDRVALGDPPRWVALRGAEAEAGECRIALEGVEDRDAAEAQRGQVVRVRRDQLPAPAEDELYVDDMIGCALVGVDGGVLGTVVATLSIAAQDLLVVEVAATGKRALVPLAEGIVLDVDLAARRVVCDPPEGLLEIEA